MGTVAGYLFFYYFKVPTLAAMVFAVIAALFIQWATLWLLRDGSDNAKH